MKKIHIIYKGKINTPTGVATVLRLFIENKIFFEEKKISIELFALDNYNNNTIENSMSEQSVPSLKNKITTYATKSYFFTVLLMKRLFDYHAKNIVKKYLAENHKDPEIAMFHDITTAFYYKKYIKSTKKIKCVLVLHTDGSATKMLYERFLVIKNRNYEKQLIKRFEETIQKMDKIIFVSSKSKKNFLNKYERLINKSNVTCVHNGILDFKTKPIPNKKNNNGVIRLINVSSISRRKGQDILIKAFEKLSYKERESFEISIVGNGEKLEEYKEYVKSKKLIQIKFLGIKKDIPLLLKQFDAFILPSREEGFPMAILEAMRAELPIIATNVGGIPEMIDSSNGFLLNPNIEELSNILKKLIIEKEELIIMGRESRKKFVKNYTVDKMLNGYVKIFNEA